MNKHEPLQRRSHLLTLRLWPEALGDGETEWCGKVQRVLSEEARYFRNWEALVGHLLALLPEVEAAGPVEMEEDDRE
jgi:hypothetical protein